MRIVITGATGNLGTALLRRLGADGGHELVGLARRVPVGDEASHGEVTWIAADLTEPACRAPLEDALRGADAVVHLAWGFQPTHDPDYLASLGVGGTGRVLDAVAACRVPRLVHMSSAGAYSPKQDDQPVDESYPTSGLPSSPYSQHKALAERLVDRFVEEHDDVVVTRMRPGLVGQRSAGSALLRYGVPALVPSRVLRHVPVVPLDRSLRMPVVHADDVADAVVRAIARDVGGPFNLAAGPPVTVADISQALGARHVHVPRRAVRAAVAGSWRLHLQQLDGSWIDLAYEVPLLNSSRATRELGWKPAHDGPSVLAEVVEGMAGADHARTPILRPRSVLDGVRRAVVRAPVGHRRKP